MSPPVAVVGLSWRDASTAERAALSMVEAPIAALRSAGYLTGAVKLTTCSRTEWVITAQNPEWAAQLFTGAVASSLGERLRKRVHVRCGLPAIGYLMRVAVGLDSVVEGEHAVGRQLLKAFELAHREGLTDRLLHLVWRNLERLIHARRAAAPTAQSLGVQTLVRDRLKAQGVRSVAIMGRGDFGLAMEKALRLEPAMSVESFARQGLAPFLQRATSVDAVVVCTAGHAPWLSLPIRDAALCVDAGSPPQLQETPGWHRVGLDSLLTEGALELSEAERLALETLVEHTTAQLTSALEAKDPSSMLAALDAERTAFLNQALPGLLVGLPPRDRKRVRQAVGAFTHRLLVKTREVSRT